ncbi:hypothetical protein BCR39DRAFT_385238 [Naematelia encephala]|uniref:Uncharacterized protein n=1 Tax=Naematelia encephala TaxID=71784 RepID=A0A1Y2AIX3_9TREE|nr:hypothetical protein BCR39DRAFT_385238 [Naematelia encephala]
MPLQSPVRRRKQIFPLASTVPPFSQSLIRFRCTVFRPRRSIRPSLRHLRLMALDLHTPTVGDGRKAIMLLGWTAVHYQFSYIGHITFDEFLTQGIVTV